MTNGQKNGRTWPRFMPTARQLRVISSASSVLVLLKFATTGYSRLLHSVLSGLSDPKGDDGNHDLRGTNYLKEVDNKVTSGSIERDVRKLAHVSFS